MPGALAAGLSLPPHAQVVEGVDHEHGQQAGPRPRQEDEERAAGGLEVGVVQLRQEAVERELQPRPGHVPQQREPQPAEEACVAVLFVYP